MLEFFYKKSNGAVTIFLTIILVPILAFTGIFVDVGRMWLAQSVTASSADLAMNTIMTGYDKELNEYYGLIASCQNAEEFMDVSEEYFKTSLNSQIIDESYLDKLWEEITDLADGVKDLTGIESEEVVEKTEKSAMNMFLMEQDSAVIEMSKAYSPEEMGSGSDLSNPVFLKAQIVEFMKYRAPIGLAESVLEHIAEIKSDIDKSKQDKKLQKAEQKTYEIEEDFLTELEKAYKNITEYESLGITESTINDIIGSDSGYKADYEEIHKRMIDNYAGVDTSSGKYPQISFKYQYQYNYFTEPLYVGNEKFGDGGGKRKASTDSTDDINYIKNTIKQAVEQITIFENARTNVFTKIANALSSAGISESDINDTVYAPQLIAQIYSEDLENAITTYNQSADDVMDYYVKLDNIQKYGGEALDSITDTLKIKNNMFTDNSAYAEDYLNIDKTYREHLEKAADIIYNGSRTDIFDSYMSNEYAWIYNVTTEMKVIKIISDNSLQNTTINQNLVESRSTDNVSLATIKSVIEGKISIIENAITYLTKIEKNATNLIKEFKAYEKEYEKWKKQTTLYSSDYCELSKENLDADALKNAGITLEDLESFKSRINNIKALLTDVKEQIETMKYAGKKLSEIGSVEDMINAVEAKKAVKGKVTTTALETVKSETWKFESAITGVTINNDNNPDFAVNQTQTYKYLKNEIKIVNEEEKTENKEKYKAYKEEGEKAEENTQTKIATEDSDYGDIKKDLEDMADKYPSGLETEDNGVDLLEGLISIAGDFATDGFSKTVERYRDILYTVNYCMEMFSYVTYQKETEYNYMFREHNEEDSTKFVGINDLSAKISISAITKLNSFRSSCADELNSIFTDSNPKNRENKSLTNKMINKDNNYAYTREIEYILFGKSNKENIKELGTELFQIRYALNIGPGIKKLWNDEEIKLMSSGISTATGGVLPELLVRMIMVMLLIALESSNDVSLLMAGIPVQFLKVKDNSDWVYDTDYFNDSLNDTDSTSTDNTSLRFQYSDYLMILLFLQLKDNNKANDVYKRIGDVIQANLSKKVLSNDDYQLSNAITQYKLSYQFTVKPIILNLGIYNGFENNPVNKTEWRTFSGSIIRGY